MHFSLTTVILSLAALAAALPQDTALVVARQNGNRPTASGTCCVPNTSLKQDACNSDAGAGRCVPGGNACKCSTPVTPLPFLFLLGSTMLTAITGGGALSCVAQTNLACDTSITERGKSLCRAKAPGGGFTDGAQTIQSLSQAKVN